MALGRVIVRQLELQDSGTVLDRWIAHHLAEVIARGRTSLSGRQKVESEARAVDLVLKLWAHRRALPEPVDPLGGYRKAVEVLGRMAPDANPWAYYRQSGTYNDLLREMFELLSTIMVAGVLLTQVSRERPITEEESKALEEEERYLHSMLEQWMSFVVHWPPKPDIKIEFVSTWRDGGCRGWPRSWSGARQFRQSGSHVGGADNSPTMPAFTLQLLQNWNVCRLIWPIY